MRSTHAPRPEARRKALEAAYPDIVTDDLPEWNQDPGLLDWLTAYEPVTCGYAQRSTADLALTRPDTSALRITQHCT